MPHSEYTASDLARIYADAAARDAQKADSKLLERIEKLESELQDLKRRILLLETGE